MTSHPADHQQPRSRQVPRSPPGRTTFSPGIIDEIQRGRVIDSLAATAAEHGYGGVTVERILRHAHMSARTFYALFDDREACLLAAHRVLAARLQAGLEAAWQLEGDWPAKVRAALAAALAFALRKPAAAQFLAAEIQAGDRAARAAQAESIDRLAAKLSEGRRPYPAADGLNPSTERVIVAGLVALIGNRLLAGQVELLSDCEPELVELALAPFLGAGRARGFARS